MIVCNNCGNSIAPGQTTCAECGNASAATVQVQRSANSAVADQRFTASRSSSSSTFIIVAAISGAVLFLALGAVATRFILSRESRDQAQGSIAAPSSPNTSSRLPEPDTTPFRTTSPPVSLPSPSSQAVNEVVDTLNGWAAATRAHDLDSHMNYYAETLDTYFLKRNVSAAYVRSNRSPAYARYHTLDVQLSNTRSTLTHQDRGRPRSSTRPIDSKAAKFFPALCSKGSPLAKHRDDGRSQAKEICASITSTSNRMIFCNQCGSQLDASGMCGECVAALPNPLPDASRSYQLTDDQPSPIYNQPAPTMKWIFILAGAVVLGFTLLIFLSSRSSSTGSNEIAATTSAEALNKAIENRRLITLTGDDAYTYFEQLKNLDPANPALKDVKDRVLPDLLNIGEEMVQRKVNHSGEVSEQDWRIFIRAYEWARRLQPNETRIEARSKYAQGKLAEVQGRRLEAWQFFSSATEFDPGWGVPQNDLGYWTTQDSSSNKQKWANAVPYYEKAISLMPDWEIPYNNLGTAYFYLGNHDQAELYYRQAIERDSNWARPHKWLGDIYLNRNDPATALAEYQTAANLFNPATDSLDISYIQRKIAQLRARGY